MREGGSLKPTSAKLACFTFTLEEFLNLFLFSLSQRDPLSFSPPLSPLGRVFGERQRIEEEEDAECADDSNTSRFFPPSDPFAISHLSAHLHLTLSFLSFLIASNLLENRHNLRKETKD